MKVIEFNEPEYITITHSNWAEYPRPKDSEKEIHIILDKKENTLFLNINIKGKSVRLVHRNFHTYNIYWSDIVKSLL